MSSWKTNSRGFTLIELLIGLVLASIFAVVLFQFVNGQARFTMAQDARQEVEQNSRGAVELMMSELRAVPGGAITISDDDRIQFRLPRIWGILCGPVAGGVVRILLPPAQTEGAVFPADYPGSIPWGLAILDSTVTNSIVFSTTTVTDTVSYNGAACTASLGTTFPADSNPAHPLELNLSSTPAQAGGVGTMAFLYHTVTYDVGTSTVAPGDWLRRSTAADGTSQQPVAGPLAEAEESPIAFAYFCNEAPIDGSNAALRPFITKVQIATAMQSRPSTRSVLQVERDTVTVHLRNSGAVTCP